MGVGVIELSTRLYNCSSGAQIGRGAEEGAGQYNDETSELQFLLMASPPDIYGCFRAAENIYMAPSVKEQGQSWVTDKSNKESSRPDIPLRNAKMCVDGIKGRTYIDCIILIRAGRGVSPCPLQRISSNRHIAQM